MVLNKLIIMGVLLLLVGCGQQQQNTQANLNQANGNMIYEMPTDDRGNNPEILNQDGLFHIGDLGLESELTDGASISHHQGHDYNTIHEVFPNRSIPPLNGSYVENVISLGKNYMGTPYQYGSDRSDPSAFDCSDFTRWAYLASLGMDLPKDSRSQARYVDAHSNRKVWNIREASRGDLLFFMSYKGPTRENYSGINKNNETITHVGIYLGNGRMLHTASQRTGGVRIDNVFDTHYEYRFMRGGSVLP
ncbi:C40 family peptidase [Ammoniphilus sp. CFH 90114]|uniref:C40 family peptidase n=1 Tax=Ammoniphilus sp. CFH 90114 TaxID=2493665 RepID=UPI00100F42C2|nr:C40 family peptidase [Ammoniphilus sp. CFH 90114]RXT08964.1 NlpC/P60 family protein [Ammoniphilus sp. CFH 90114]